jgi:hypothetical protein
MKILISIVTTEDSNWRAKFKEAKQLGVKEIGLFLTCLEKTERRELYRELKKSGIKKVPFVHLRSDMDAKEIDWLMKNYGTKVFNVHSAKHHPLLHDLSQFRKRIYMENNLHPVHGEVGNWAGVCLDVSHFEDKRLRREMLLLNDVRKTLKKYPVGLWHLNAIMNDKATDGRRNHRGYDQHYFTDLKQLDYCVRYKKYLPKHYIVFELENSLKEQLMAKKYVEKLLK